MGPTEQRRRRRLRWSLPVAVLLALLLPATALAAPDTTIDSDPPGLTNDNVLTFEFSSDDPAATFECAIDVPSFGQCSDLQSHTTDLLPDGVHKFFVRAVDEAATPDDSPAEQTFTVDTTPPNAAIDSGPAGGSTISDPTPTFGFSSEAGATFECRVDADPFDTCSGPGDSHTPGALGDGPHTFEVRATDAVGNTNPASASRSFTVDTTPPDTGIDSGPSGTTADVTPTFDFSGGGVGATYECRVDAGGFGACSGPGRSHTTGVLSDGAHTFAVRATDAAGNVDLSPATRAFTVDATAPAVEITNQPSTRVQTREKSARVAVEFLSEAGAVFECRLDDRAYQPCSSPFSTPAAAGSGKGREHSISVRATDAVGNTGAPTRIEFRVRRAPPLEKRAALKTVRTALKRHGFARRVVRSVEADCKRRGRYQFACRFSTRFPGYQLRGRGKVKLGESLSYAFRVKAQGVRLTLSDENEG